MVGVTGSILVVPITHTLWLCGEINDRNTIGILKACAQYSRIGAVSADGQAANSPILSPICIKISVAHTAIRDWFDH
jgi:hypothetical protein